MWSPSSLISPSDDCGAARVDHLVKAIIEYLENRNRYPKPFVWTASVDSILAKLRGCMPITETIH